MQLLIKSYRAFLITFGIFVISLLGLYVIWLRHLREPVFEGEVADEPAKK
jgi:hypothetical protein